VPENTFTFQRMISASRETQFKRDLLAERMLAHQLVAQYDLDEAGASGV